MPVTRTTTIEAPAETVFDYVADISRHDEWATPAHRLHVKKASDGPSEQGATFNSVGHQFGEHHETVRITEFLPAQRIVYDVDGDMGHYRHSIELAPTNSGVKVTKTFAAVKPSFPFNLMSPIMRRFMMPSVIQGDLERIKARLEG